MKVVYLNRLDKSDQGSFGIWSCPEINFSCFSLELPWRENKVKFSCIPADTYLVEIRYSKKYGWHYHVTNVKGRTWILLHTFNLAGDVTKGYKTQSLGCIALGKARGYLNGQKAVFNSRIMVRQFFNLMNKETFKLIIS